MTPAREAELRARPRHDRFYGDTHAALMEALDALAVVRAQRDAARLIVDAPRDSAPRLADGWEEAVRAALRVMHRLRDAAEAHRCEAEPCEDEMAHVCTCVTVNGTPSYPCPACIERAQAGAP